MRVPLGHVLAFLAPLLDGPLSFGHTPRDPLLLLAPDADGPFRSASLPRVGLRSLAPDREVAPVTQPSVGADLHESLDVQGHLSAEVALDLVAPVDELAEAV